LPAHLRAAACRPWQKIRRAPREAENIGVETVFNYDHFFRLSGDPNGKVFECWTVPGAWAESTSGVETGALVSCNAYRNPDLLRWPETPR